MGLPDYNAIVCVQQCCLSVSVCARNESESEVCFQAHILSSGLKFLCCDFVYSLDK